MAEIQKYTAREQLDTDRGGMPRPQFSGAVGEALQGLGRSVQSAAAHLQERQEQRENFKTDAAYKTMQLNLGAGMQELADNSMPDDGAGFHDAYIKDVYNPARQKFLESVPERLRPKYEALLNDEGPDTATWSIKAAEAERDQSYKWYSSKIAESNDMYAKAIAADPEGYDKYLKEGMDLIDNSGLPNTVKREEKKKWESFAQVAYLDDMVQKDPSTVLRVLGADPNTLSPTAQLDVLEQAVAAQETGGEQNPDTAVSKTGAIGRLQVMPGTARDIAKQLGDTNFPTRGDPTQVAAYLMQPSVNKRYGRHYLQQMLRKYPGDVEAALVAYHSGPGNADKWLKAGRDNSVLGPEGRKYAEGVLSKLPNAVQSGVRNAVDYADVKLNFIKSGKPVRDSVEGEAGVRPELTNRIKASVAGVGIKEINITSGHRGSLDNAARGGAERSQHVHGNAVDIDVSKMNQGERVRLIMSLSANGITGLGIGANIIHADLGKRRAWGYASSQGGGAVPEWARGAIQKHMAKTATVEAVGPTGRFASLSYDKRQAYIRTADAELAKQTAAANKANVAQRVQVQQAMATDLANVYATGQGTSGFDATDIATVLGEDDYAKYLVKREEASKTYVATNDLHAMTAEELDARLQEYQPISNSPTRDMDERVYAKLQREVDRITKLRASSPDKAAMEFPDVKAAYDAVVGSTNNGTKPADSAAMQEFVRLSLEKQKEFNLKPGSEAPVPRTMAITIGKALSRKPDDKVTATEMRALIAQQYQELQKVFGPYTEEVIIQSMQAYKGIDKDEAEIIVAYMEMIERGGDPFKLKQKNEDDDFGNLDSNGPSMLDIGRAARGGSWLDAFGGEPPAASTPDDPDRAEAAGDPEIVRRARDMIEGGDPEDLTAAIERYGERAVQAAQRQLEGK